MEAHPPYRLPVGLHPSGLPACGGCASSMGRTIPLPLSWKEGGKYISVGYGGTSSIPPASGVAPLWTPRLRGLRFDYGADHPPNPLPSRKGESKEKCRLWRHILHTACQRGCAPLDSPLSARHIPLPPAKGVAPLWTPRLRGLVPRFTVPGSLADKRPGIPQPPVGRG